MGTGGEVGNDTTGGNVGTGGEVGYGTTGGKVEEDPGETIPCPSSFQLFDDA